MDLARRAGFRGTFGPWILGRPLKLLQPGAADCLVSAPLSRSGIKSQSTMLQCWDSFEGNAALWPLLAIRSWKTQWIRPIVYTWCLCCMKIRGENEMRVTCVTDQTGRELCSLWETPCASPRIHTPACEGALPNSIFLRHIRRWFWKEQHLSNNLFM